MVAVDWALNKEAYMKQNNNEEEEDEDDDDSDDEEPKFEISGFEDKSDEEEEDRPKVSPPPPAAPGVTLFVCNIPLSASRGDILRTFGVFGHIESLKCVRDRVSGAFRGSAFVQYVVFKIKSLKTT